MRRVTAFAPGRVNLIGEHTDYNDGLALPFAIERGITVTAAALAGDQIEAVAHDLGETDRFTPATVDAAPGWRAYVRGVTAELVATGHVLPAARLGIAGDLPPGGGLASSAALAVATALALLALADVAPPEPFVLADVCARAESRWAGAETGLLDQLAILTAAPGHAIRIDFASHVFDRVPIVLPGWSFALLDSGVRHDHASGAYNQRRAECRRAAELLGLGSLRDAGPGEGDALPSPLNRRVRHVTGENARVDRMVAALGRRDGAAIGALLDECHASLRDDFDVSVPAVEAAVARLHTAGAVGARMVGGGFGGHVLALFPPGVSPAREIPTVRAGNGASTTWSAG
jgi:galactokinase